MATGDQYQAGLRHSTTGELYTRSDPTSTTTVAVSTPGMAAIGFYGQINPYGTTRVTVEPSAQSWVTLAANVNVVATLAAVVSTALTSATPFLSLTTGSTAAVTADVFIFGYCID